VIVCDIMGVVVVNECGFVENGYGRGNVDEFWRLMCLRGVIFI
jgi:hypothetical protein